jgi:hypothetical protein
MEAHFGASSLDLVRFFSVQAVMICRIQVRQKRSGSATLFGATKTHFKAMNSQPGPWRLTLGTLQTCLGAINAQPAAVGGYLQPWRLTLEEWRLKLELLWLPLLPLRLTLELCMLWKQT